MQRPDRLDAVAVVVAALTAGLVVRLGGAGFAEWMFFGSLLLGAVLVVRALVSAWSARGQQRSRSAAAVATTPGEVAAEAVRQERARIAVDTAASLRRHLAEVRVLATPTGDAAGLEERARLIHARSRQASSELRRHLGLLRDPGPEAGEAARVPDRGVPPARPPQGVAFSDLALGSLVALVALVEASAAVSADPGRAWTSVSLTTATAFTVTWHRAAPGQASLVASGLFVTGVVVADGVVPGLWLLPALGLLLWGALAGRVWTWSRGAAGLVLPAATVLATEATDPVNGPVTLVVALVLVAAAVGTGAARRAAARHERDAGDREAVFEQASDLAVHAERAAFARELHDVVSHAVGLIAMQAAAAEVSWCTDRSAAERAMQTIGETVSATLVELDRVGPGPALTALHGADLGALLERVRAAGTHVDAFGLELVPPDHRPAAYRVVQESLTNVLRHAPGARARVEVVMEEGTTRVTVTDDGPGAPRGSDRGYGLVGLRERVEFAGGTFAAGRAASGCGFMVEAVLPAVGDAASRRTRATS
jgi:signal transduction histidine kinase